ncbi:MAG: hypothetical protein H6738_08980 [Alphaproteobacteria bacterium]|nr:hypothetical protein [Alphaproteobacteria bacterium]
MSRTPAPTLAALAAGLLLVGSQACSKRLPHGGDNPLYPLIGNHAAVPCEGCHGPGTPQTLPTACIDCHDDDRPAPSHYPGQDCAECHTPEGWLVGVTTVPTTGETGITTPTHTGETTGHPTVAPDQLCWDCHETDRKDDTHYKDATVAAKSWDCGPCHTQKTGWLDGLVQHPARTPHASYVANAETPRNTWVVACDTCHPDSLATFDCERCHTAIYPHYGDASKPGPAANASCLGCHPYGDK